MDIDRPLSSEGRLQQRGEGEQDRVEDDDAATAPPDQEECAASSDVENAAGDSVVVGGEENPTLSARGVAIDSTRTSLTIPGELNETSRPAAEVDDSTAEKNTASSSPEGEVQPKMLSFDTPAPPWVSKLSRRASRSEESETSLDAEAEESLDTEAYCRRMWQGQSNILVVVRIRPLLQRDDGTHHIVKVLQHNVVVVLDPGRADETKNVLRARRSREKRYAFDYVFDEHQKQQTVYNRTTKFLIQGVLDGFNATVFAYGQTGAGKTYTMIGSKEQPGIMVQTMRDLFRHSERVEEEHRMQIKVIVSFLEVYNENIRDLLSNDYDKEVPEFLDLREDPIKGPVVAGITEVEASTPDEVMALLQRGNARRSQHYTAANETSSRSHAVLQIIVETRENAEGTAAQINIGKLSLVDLAGSERAANTKNRGDRLKEGANINRSLLTLGNCINALGEKASRGQFVPYRDSKLTRLLKDSLGGNCRTVMIANISAASSSFEETLNTLKYANRAKNIKTNVQRNVLEVNHHISEYVTLIQNLRSEVTVLKQQLATNGGSSNVSNTINLPHPPSGEGGGSARYASRDREDMSSATATSSVPVPDSLVLENMTTSPHAMGLQTPSTDKAVLKEMKAWMQENFRERMQLRRTLIELEEQNVQNSIEIGKRQILIANWNASRVHTPNDGASTDHVAAALVENSSPEDVRTAYDECEQLRKAIDKNNATKKSTSKRLRENERQAEQFHKDLRENRRVTGEERRELLELMYRIGNLELGNMQLEQAQVIHDSVVKGKDLTIQKLQLQVLMRDKVISKQRDVLQNHGIHDVGNLGNLLMEDRAISQNFDAIRALSPPAPLDSTYNRKQNNIDSIHRGLGGSQSRVVLVKERKAVKEMPIVVDLRRRASSPRKHSEAPRWEERSRHCGPGISGRRQTGLGVFDSSGPLRDEEPASPLNKAFSETFATSRRPRPRHSPDFSLGGPHASGLLKTGDTSAESDVESSHHAALGSETVLPSAVVRFPRPRRKRSQHPNGTYRERQGRRRPPLGPSLSSKTVFKASGANAITGHQAFTASGFSSNAETERRSKRKGVHTTKASGDSSKVYPCNDDESKRGSAVSVPEVSDENSIRWDLEIHGVQQARFRPPHPSKSIGIGSLRSKLAQRANSQSSYASSNNNNNNNNSGAQNTVLEPLDGPLAVECTAAGFDKVAGGEGPGRDAIDALLTSAAPPTTAVMAS